MDAYIKIADKKYRLAFTMKQWEIQVRLMKEHTSDLDALTCMIFSAIIVAAKQDGNKEIEQQLDYEDVEIEVDKQVSENTKEWQAILQAKDESYLYKKAKEIEEEEKKRLLTLTTSESSLSDT